MTVRGAEHSSCQPTLAAAWGIRPDPVACATLKAPFRLGEWTPSRWRRLGTWTLAGLVGFFVVYAVAAAIVLGNGRLGRLISNQPESLRVEYTHATSFFFGRAHVEGLDIRVRDDDIEWEVHIDRADASISLLSLLAKRFHTSRIEAQGVTFRMRMRREEKEVDDALVARLPPIDGFSAAAIRGVPSLPHTDDGGKPFVIDLEGITLTDVREVWLDAYRLSGDLSIQGAFTVAPRDHLTVAPTHIDVVHATLTTGDEAVIQEVHGPLDARIDPVPLARLQGASILRALSSRSSL
jgi:hypothetical protein